MKYDGINWMGWLIIITCLLAGLFIFLMVFGYSGIFWYIGVIIVGITMGLNKEENELPPNDNDYFTDEDFIHCKIGEWISRK